MSEETRESYDSGEIVWVKLGSSWWPGEVKNAEELPSDVLDFKKPPLAIVKFFDEDSYEYVKAWPNIYPYNCEKKNEFIKKGMAAYRAKVAHMDKFPKDVLTAEEKVGGNPNILSDPQFLPEKKRNYAAEVFGTPSPKAGINKNKRRSNAKSSSKKDTSHITHRRFLGVDDYRAFICIQYPGKDRTPGDKEDDEVVRINREPEQDFNCHSCSFSTKRLEVMILHTKSHIQGVYLASTRKSKQTVSRKRKEKLKKSKGSDVIESESSESEPVKQRKRKPRSQGPKKTKVKKTESQQEQPRKDIRSELLEAWEESEEEDLDISLDKLSESIGKTLDGSSSEMAKADDSLSKSDINDTLKRTDAPDQDDSIQAEIANELAESFVSDKAKSPIQTIEEALNDVAGALEESDVQKEPSKPVEEPLSTEKLLSTLEDDSMDSDSDKKDKETVEEKVDDDVSKETEVTSQEKDNDVAVEDTQKLSVDEDVSKQKMDRDIHEAIKSCFDFDEDEEEDNTIVRKATSGRKIPRVIPKTSRKKSLESTDLDADKNKAIKESRTSKDKGDENREDMDAAFKELMEITAVPDLPEVRNTLKCEQNFHNIKTIKFPDKPEQIGSPPKAERKDSTEVATKLTNPKKRFVKSFEDFELMQNEIRRREEEQLDVPETDKCDVEEDKTEASGSTSKYDYVGDHPDPDSPESNIQLSKLKSKIMSKIIEEAKAHAERVNRKGTRSQASKRKSVESELNVETVKSDSNIKTAKPGLKSEITDSDLKSKSVEFDSKPKTAESDFKSKIDESDSKSRTIESVESQSKTMESDSESKTMELDSRSKTTESDSQSKTTESDSQSKTTESDSQSKTTESDSQSKTTESDSQSKTTESDSQSKMIDSDSESKTIESDLKPQMVESDLTSKDAELNLESKIDEAVPLPKTLESDSKSTINSHEESKSEKRFRSHRTPRSKILDSYRKDVNKLKVEEKSESSKVEVVKNDGSSTSTVEVVQDRLRGRQLDKDVVPPKKGKWFRRGSHPKKDKKLFVLQEISPDVTTSSSDTPKEEIQEPAKKESQTSLELEPVEDTSKINDVIIDEPQPTQNDEIIPSEAIEEEIVTIAKEVKSIETLQLTESEAVTVQVGTSCTSKDTTLVIEEVKEKEKLPSAIMDATEIKETPEENEPVIAVDDTSSKQEPSEFVEEANVQEVPFQVQEVPLQVQEVPLQVEEVPLQVQEVPLQVEEVSLQVEEVPLQVQEVPPQVQEIPPQVQEVPPQVQENLPQVQEVLPQVQEVPEKLVPTEEEEGRTAEEMNISATEEETVNLQPKGDSSSTEEPSQDKQVLPVNNSEDSSVVPLNETEIADGDKSCPEPVEVVEEQIVEESMILSPITPVADTYVSIEDTSLSVPPRDIFTTPPKKSKKRKMSSSDLTSSPVKTGITAELLSEDFAPLEKRKKEVAVTQEEIVDASSMVESVADRNDIEVTVEGEQTIDVSKSEEGSKENVMESEPIGEVEELELKQNNKEPSLEAEHIECDNKTEEAKLSRERIIDTAESDKVTKESEEKEAKVEIDTKTKESEVIPEKSNIIESNKETDPSITEHNNEVEIHCAGSSADSFKFSIQTNLSILSSREEMSALALATLSEIKADLESNEDIIPKEEGKAGKPGHTVVMPVLVESEMVPIEGNLTVVSEKDLADGQVEITSEQVISPKRPVMLSNFSLDFSDSFSDSNSNSTTDTSSELGKCDFNSKGTEFTPKALTKQMKKLDHKKESTYGRLELLNILEGNSESDKKPKEYTHAPKKTSMVDDICDFEEHIPSQIVCAKALKKEVPVELEHNSEEFKQKPKKTSVKSTTSKLLERLTTESKAKASAAKISAASESPVSETGGKIATKIKTVTLSTPKNTRSAGKSKTSKPIILSEQIVKPAIEMPKSKRKKMEDIEDVEAFVIHKDPNKMNFEEEASKAKAASIKTPGKAKILQQTIITPAGEIIQPTVTEAQTDDNIFDINSMPIVLSDDILTPESIEKMPIVIGSDTKPSVVEKVVKRPLPNRIITTVATPPVTPNKTITITKHKPPRILQTGSNRVLKNSPLLPNMAKPGKYIIVPQSSIPQTPTKYVAKKPAIVKKTAVPMGAVQKVPNIAPEPSGNKIMIVTNQQGQQQRLLLTPAQQKMLGYQNQKVTKTIVKGNVMQKSVLAAKSMSLAEAGSSGMVQKTPNIIGQKVVVGANANQGLITTTTHQIISTQGRTTKGVTRRSPAASQKMVAPTSKPQKTILIKNQHGQTVRKIQGTDDELLDKQVAEQLEAIKASSGMKFNSQPKPLETSKATVKTPLRRSYSKRVEVKPRGPPPLTGIHQSPKPETVVTMPTMPATRKVEPVETKSVPAVTEENKVQPTERPLNQLVIQDAVGNQTTITEGQILALPSETVDGQPQSYMLVTLDESGNLTPLNSEALMSLDPNLGLGGDLSNMVLQIDQGSGPQTAIIKAPDIVQPVKPVEVERAPQPVVPVPEPSITTEVPETVVEQKVVQPALETVQQVAASTNGDPGQQLIVTGDPIATQKFLESLTEGTTDLANILANAEGNSILIQADGQQILINTNTDNQMLLSMNNDSVNVTENTEGGGNPIFATQPSKNQDILAAALADTDVFQQEHPSSSQSKIGSQLSPSNALYPMNVGNVLETSLTLSSPIMTPLEVPSTNSKKIPDDEADILTQVPKNVDLPITITDPNISQTVANQQVSAMIANELQTNLELALPMSEATISAVSTEMNSPSYVYSLPALDDSVEMTQKPFNGSMPLLNEDVEETMNKAKRADEDKASVEASQSGKSKEEAHAEGFLAEEEGRFTLGGEMCSSLSEPPPEMFDLPEVNQNFTEKSSVNIPSLQSTPEPSDNASKDEDTTDLSTHADTSSEGSCEIPLQPQIVAKSLDLSRNLDSLKRSLGETEGENKKCKFD